MYPITKYSCVAPPRSVTIPECTHFTSHTQLHKHAHVMCEFPYVFVRLATLAELRC